MPHAERFPFTRRTALQLAALALALPLGLWLVLGNLKRLAGNIERSREISVFLRQDVDAARATALAQELRARGAIAGVEHRTPQQGLDAMRRAHAVSSSRQASGVRAGKGSGVRRFDDRLSFMIFPYSVNTRSLY